jgi:hypothetical protein
LQELTAAPAFRWLAVPLRTFPAQLIIVQLPAVQPLLARWLLAQLAPHQKLL